MLPLVPYRDLTSWRFPEVRSADLVVRHGGLLAIACSLPQLWWAGRSVNDGRRIRHRVALYREDRLVAVFDAARFPVNDIAFHPHDPIVAIGTGSYDGGYLFEGELLIWNYQTGETRSLLDWSREVMRCRWDHDGRLTILVRPENDHDEDPDTTHGGTIDVSTTCAVHDLPPCSAVDLGFTERIPTDADRTLLGVEPRGVIWDLAWTFDNRIAVARDDNRLELWSATGTREHVIRVGGKVVELMRQPSQLLVHVLGPRSRLFALRGNELELWFELPGSHTCSVDASGHILARDTDHAPQRRQRHDLVLTASKKVLVDTNLGHYDLFNHYLRIDGAEQLFLLRGSPASSHQHKRLCFIESGDLVVHQDFVWDAEGEHRMAGSAVMLEDDIVCCYRVHHPQGGGAIRIERRVRPGGDTIWRHQVPASAIAMRAWPAVGGIVAALVDGTLCILDGDGRVLHEEPFTIDGVPTIPTALAVHDETLVVGTIDGRISLLSVR